jgi:hypothetical protein
MDELNFNNWPDIEVPIVTLSANNEE